MSHGGAGGRSRFGERRRIPHRLKMMLPVTLTMVGSDDGAFAWGKGVVSDVGGSGLRLSMVRIERGYLPLEFHYRVRIEPASEELRGLWIEARPVRVRFSGRGAELGAEVVKTAGSAEGLLGLVPA